MLTAHDLTKRNQARMVFASYIKNKEDFTNGSIARTLNLLPSDLTEKNIGAAFTSYAEYQLYLLQPVGFILQILGGNKSVSDTYNISNFKRLYYVAFFCISLITKKFKAVTGI